MSHVAEGTLHAYLDALERGPGAAALGADELALVEAHVDTCPECAAALAEARGLRARSQAVLASSTPPVEIPPFEIMGAQVPRLAPRRRWIPLAWAASLVMAVGAGWIGSGLWRSGGIAPAVEQRTASSETPAVPSAPPESDQAEQVPAQGAVAAAPSPAPTPRAERAAVGGEADQVKAQLADARDAAGVSAEAAAAQAAAEPAPVAEPQLAERSVEDLRVAPPAAERERALGAAAARSAVPAPAASQFAAAAARSAMDTLHYAGDADVAWQPVSLAVAEARLGRPLELLAEGRVLAVELAEPGVVRVRQRLPSGSEAEVVQWRRPADEGGERAAAAEPAEPGEMRIVRQGIATDARGWVVLARSDVMIALKAPPGVLPLALVSRLERQP